MKLCWSRSLTPVAHFTKRLYPCLVKGQLNFLPFHQCVEKPVWCIQCVISLQRRHNEHDGASYHRRIDCLLNRLFNLRVTGLCEGNSPLTVKFPAQKANNGVNVSIWWRHHVISRDRWPYSTGIVSTTLWRMIQANDKTTCSQSQSSTEVVSTNKKDASESAHNLVDSYAFYNMANNQPKICMCFHKSKSYI